LKLAHFPSTIVAFAIVFAAAAQERGRLIGVKSGGDETSSAVELIGNRPLSFTTLQLESPPRVVVDFADTEVAGAPAELSVEDGTVRRVAAAPAGASVARVVIELVADAEFDVRAVGNRVEVRVPRIGPVPPKVAQAELPRPPKPTPPPSQPPRRAEENAARAPQPEPPSQEQPRPTPAEPQAPPPPKGEPQAVAEAPRVAPPKIEPQAQAEAPPKIEPQAQAEAPRPPDQLRPQFVQPPPPRAHTDNPPPQVAKAAPAEAQPERPQPDASKLEPQDEEAKKRASLPTVSLLGEQPAKPKPLTPAEKKRIAQQQALEAQKEAARVAAEKRAEKKRLLAEAAARKKEDEARKQHERAERAAAAKRAAREAAERVAAAKRAAREAAEQKRREKAERVASVQPARKPLKKPETEEDRVARAQAEERRLLDASRDAAIARARADAAAEERLRMRGDEPAPARSSEKPEKTAAITGIGFRPVGAGAVIVHSSAKLEYEAEDVDRAVILHVAGASIPRANDRRVLDTEFFGGPVLRVVPILAPNGIDLRIELRRSAHYEIAQQGDALIVTFSSQ
jgi:hypothetical protein